MGFSTKAVIALTAVALSAEVVAAAPMVVGRTANLRTGPGLNYPLAGTIAAGQVVDMGACARGWCQVTWSGGFFGGLRTAYTPRAFLVAAARAPVVASSAPAAVAAPASVTVAAGPAYGYGWGAGYWDTWGPFGLVAAPFALFTAPFYGAGYYGPGYAAPLGAPAVAAGVTVASAPAQTVTVRRTRRVAVAPRPAVVRVAQPARATTVGLGTTVRTDRAVSVRRDASRSVSRQERLERRPAEMRERRGSVGQRSGATSGQGGAARGGSGSMGGGMGGSGMGGSGTGGSSGY